MTTTQRMPKVIHHLCVYEIDGKQTLDAVFVKHECGCKIIGGGTCPHPLEIQFCPMHAAAPDYHEAAECYARWVDHYKYNIPDRVLRAMEAAFGSKLRAAIEKATPLTPAPCGQ